MPNQEDGVHINTNGDVNVGGDIVGRDKITVNIINRYQRHHAEPQPKFLVPYPRNSNFVGRDDDLRILHAQLQEAKTAPVRPVMLTGLGGVGKSQLAVEYAYRFRIDFPGVIYWLNAGQDWLDELAALAEGVGFRSDDAPKDDRCRLLAGAFADFLKAHPQALLIFDNVDDPRLLRTPKPGFSPSELSCRLLFTSRRLAPDLPFTSIQVQALSESAALELLLRECLQTILEPQEV